MHVRVKRVYERPELDDGMRVLVDRLWPRGLSKDKAAIDLWAKDVAPSDALRRWFHAHREQWQAFAARYRDELADRPEALADLRAATAGHTTVTLLYGSRDTARNNAVVLADVLRSH